MTGRGATSLPRPSRPKAQSTASKKNQEESGYLGNPGGLYHRRAALALREARRFILVCVNAAELFPVGIVDTDEVMVMFAAAILAKRTLASIRAFCRHTFCHVGHPI